MATGISVHVGVNNAQGNFDVRELSGCRGDAEAMFKIAEKKGFQPHLFLDGEATHQKVEAAILQAAQELNDGDIFLFTFAGHGSFTPTLNPQEHDGQDESILLHDCLLIDDYLRRNLWSQFKPGVRILGIADSCHSGTVLMASLNSGAQPTASVAAAGVIVNAVGVSAAVAPSMETRRRQVVPAGSAELNPRTRRDPGVVWENRSNRGITATDRTRIRHVSPQIHQQLTAGLLSPPADELKATLLTIAACRDREFALDGPENGAFTRRLLEVWNDGNFEGNYDEFVAQIRTPFEVDGSRQHPMIQSQFADDAFVQQQPFTI